MNPVTCKLQWLTICLIIGGKRHAEYKRKMGPICHECAYFHFHPVCGSLRYNILIADFEITDTFLLPYFIHELWVNNNTLLSRRNYPRVYLLFTFNAKKTYKFQR